MNEDQPPKTDPEIAREEAAAIKPATWTEGDETFFYPTLDNYTRFALHDLLLRMADRQEELERINETFRKEIHRLDRAQARINNGAA